MKTRVCAAPAADSEKDAAPHYVWYACFGSNILLERFNCYLQGGRIAGMVADMVSSRRRECYEAQRFRRVSSSVLPRARTD
jgi:hypothetical protein